MDIDGVLVTTRHLVQSKRYFGHEFDQTCVENLNAIIKSTDSRIVVTSSWKEGRTLKQLQSIFEINGVRHVVGMTPLIEGVIRGQEIQSYMDHAKGTELEVEQFVIIDDEEEMGDLQPYLLETEFQTGITSLIRDKSIKKLI